MAIEDFLKSFSYFGVSVRKPTWEYTYLRGSNDPKHANYYRFTITDYCEAYFRVHL